MNQTSNNFHHALPAILSDKSAADSTVKLTHADDDIDSWVAKLKETYFDDINALPTRGASQASSQPMENTE